MAGAGDIANLLGMVNTGVKAVATTALSSLTQIGDSVNAFTRKFVEAFRPDVVKRFDLVTKDLLGTIGEALVPVMERGGVVVRQLADLLNGVFRAIRPLIDRGFAVLDPLLATLATTVQKLASVMVGAMLPVYEQLIQYAERMAPVWAELIPLFARVGGAIIQFQAAFAAALMPVVVALVPIVKALADALAGLIPVLLIPFKAFAAVVGPLVKLALLPLTTGLTLAGKVVQPLAALLKGLGEAFGELAGEVAALAGDLLGAFVDVLAELAGVVLSLLDPVKDFVLLLANGLVTGLKAVVTGIKGLIASVREFLGLVKEGTGVDGDSRGKGARGVNFGSADSAWQNVVTATYGMGRQDEAKQATIKSASHLEVVGNWFRDNGPMLAKAAQKLAETAGSTESKTGKALSEAGGNFMADLARSMVLQRR